MQNLIKLSPITHTHTKQHTFEKQKNRPYQKKMAEISPLFPPKLQRIADILQHFDRNKISRSIIHHLHWAAVIQSVIHSSGKWEGVYNKKASPFPLFLPKMTDKFVYRKEKKIR